MPTEPIGRTASQKSDLVSDLQNNCINVETREIYLHSVHEHDEEPGVDYRIASKFIKNINLLGSINKKPILVHQIISGGDWLYGMSMYDAVKTCQSYVTFLTYAGAQSMSSLIMQAADCRVMMPHCNFMIHEGSMSASDTIKSFLSSAEEVKKSNQVMLNIYLNKVKNSQAFKGKSDKYICSYLQNKMDQKQEWYLNAAQAVHYGFVDAVLGMSGYENVEVLLRG